MTPADTQTADELIEHMRQAIIGVCNDEAERCVRALWPMVKAFGIDAVFRHTCVARGMFVGFQAGYEAARGEGEDWGAI